MIKVTVPRIGTAAISVVIHCSGSDIAGDNKCHAMICRGQRIKQNISEAQAFETTSEGKASAQTASSNRFYLLRNYSKYVLMFLCMHCSLQERKLHLIVTTSNFPCICDR